eukprot:TRINITY_DN107071_c0_g1_i1.p1 TRINITY_DN107071_c0_g1~~TRINITY_DN107071_c0_g1_i1.p1  ORF type:complete len:285 (-),score=38.27 TRINITY_DN107071_c0_g1_i1:162-968(-)
MLPVLLALAAALTPPALSENLNANCSQVDCEDAQWLCGHYTEPCKAIGPASYGLQLWIQNDYQFFANSTYRLTSRSYFDKPACNVGLAWLEMIHEGSWRHTGGSATVIGKSRATREVVKAWIKVLQSRPCLTPVGSLPPEQCFDSSMAMKAVCPCNGWDWLGQGAPRGKNIAMFCSPAKECPILHEVYLQQLQYFSYSASKEQSCFMAASTEKARGWDKPQNQGCFERHVDNECQGMAYADSAFSLMSRARLLLALVCLVGSWRIDPD